MTSFQDKPTIAVFLDVENLFIHAGQQGVTFRVGPILDRARSEGRVIVARAYGDFAKGYMEPVHNDLRRSVFELAQLPTDQKGKNTADMLLSLDALEMCLQPSPPAVIVIGSGDRDYVPLVQRLRRYNARVIGVGLLGSISASLKTVCDDYWYYEDIAQPAASAPSTAPVTPPGPSGRRDPVDKIVALFIETIRNMEAANEQAIASRVLDMMRSKLPSFQYQELGFAKFIDFANHVAEQGLIRVETHGSTVSFSSTEGEDPLEKAAVLCHEVVRNFEESGEPALASRVNEGMRQTDPSFKHQDLGFPRFVDFANSVASRGLIRVISQGTTVVLSAASLSSDMPEPSVEETTAQLTNRYRSVLDRKRVTLVDWEVRRTLVTGLWRELAQSDDGMTIQQMSDSILVHAAQQGFHIPTEAVYKLTYTLNIGRCFRINVSARFIEDIFGQKAKPACDEVEALDRMNVTYVRGVLLDRPDLPLRQDAVARFLFGEPTETQIQLSADYIRRAREWRDY